MKSYYWRCIFSEEPSRKRQHLVCVTTKPLTERLCHPGRVINRRLTTEPVFGTPCCRLCMKLAKQGREKLYVEQGI